MFTICSLYIHYIFIKCSLCMKDPVSFLRNFLPWSFAALSFIVCWCGKLKFTSQLSQLSLYVHNMFTICSLFVLYLFTICSLYVHYLFTICSIYIHYIFTRCSPYVHYFFTICSLYIHCIFTICSPYMKDAASFLWNVLPWSFTALIFVVLWCSRLKFGS